MKLSYMKLSYMKWYFLKMFAAVILLIGILVFAITGFSKKVVGKEIISLHQSILSQSIVQPAATIRGLRGSLEKITENAAVVEWLMADTRGSGKIDTFIQDEIYGNYKRGNKFRIYIYDLEKLRYASDFPEISWEEAQPSIQEAKKLESSGAKEDIYLKGLVRSEKEAGLYRHSFYMVRPVRDLLSGAVRGYVLMQFSEVILYDMYQELIEPDRDYCIIDGNGIVVSAKNKRDIGAPYSKNNIVISNEAFQEVGYGISEAYPDNVYFYGMIWGTDWYLLENADLRHIFAPLDRTAWFAGILVVIFAACFLPSIVLALGTILKPIDVIKNKMNQVAQGDFKARISQKEKGKGELSEIADSFNYMVGKLESQVEEIRVIERKRHLLHLDFLQTQINPHFIYNTLSSIRFYVEMGKNEEAEKMLIDFSKILRKTLSSSEKFISLKEECETLQYYIELQKARYRDRFEVKFNMEEDTLSCIVPDFIMQPIVENAIFYSLKEKQVCHILISSHIREKKLCVSVKDDGVGMDENMISSVLEKGMNMNKVGLRNVNDRLRLNFGESYGIRILSEKGVGTEVIMEMPVTNERKRLG